MTNIDLSKLSRDFNKFPVNSKNLPTKGDIEYLYSLNIKKADIAQFFGITIRMFENYTKKLGVYTNRFSKLDKDLLYDLYIVKNLSISDICLKLGKSDVTVSKYLKLYGIKKNINSIVSCRENWFIKNRGVKNPSQLQSVKDKKVATCIKNFGTKYPTQSSDVLDTRYNRCIEKYGVKSEKQIHIGKHIYDIINSKENLINIILDKGLDTTYKLSKYLEVNELLVQRAIKKLDLWGYIKSNTSSYETIIRDLFNNISFSRNRTILDGKEIDLYSDEHKVGIEFNGNYWHNNNHKDRLYHQKKSLLAQDKGIFLYHIFEYEWNDTNKRDRIINQLNNLLCLNIDTIYARKCEVREVLTADKQQFLDNNHVQGSDKCSISLGLYYNNELVSLMTFTKPRFNKNYQYELSRFCSKAGTNVVGGASKLFKHFIREYKPTSIISYSDIAKTTGKIYETLGFKLHSIASPNYVWVKGKSVLTRYQCQKHKLVKLGYDKSKSESQIMEDRGYTKLYDCGNKVWILNI